MEVTRVTKGEYEEKVSSEPVEIKKAPETMLSWGWILLAVLLPIAGVIAGIWGLNKEDKKDGGTLIALSVGFWIFWMFML